MLITIIRDVIKNSIELVKIRFFFEWISVPWGNPNKNMNRARFAFKLENIAKPRYKYIFFMNSVRTAPTKTPDSIQFRLQRYNRYIVIMNNIVFEKIMKYFFPDFSSSFVNLAIITPANSPSNANSDIKIII